MNEFIEDIACDVDSTILPLLRVMNTLPGGENVRYEDCLTWDHLPVLCGGVDKMLALFDEAMKFETMDSLGKDAIYEGAKEALTSLASRNVRIHIVTDRPQNRMADTERFLRERGIPFHSIQKVSSKDKVQWCIDNNVCLLIDDHPDTLLAAHEADLEAHTIWQLYSAHQAHARGQGVHANWADMADAIHASLDQVFA